MAGTQQQLETPEPRVRPAPRAAYSQIPRSYFKLKKRCTPTEHSIVGTVLDRMYCLQGADWVRITEAELADEANVSVEIVHRSLKKIGRWAPGDLPDEDDDLEFAEDSLQLLLVRRAGRGREYKALDQNFLKAPLRDPRTVTRKPPQSEGIVDADPHSSAGFTEVGSSPPLRALRQAAPNAVFVQINGGPPIALAEACPNAQTCGLAQKFGLIDEQLSERDQNSSAGIGLVVEKDDGEGNQNSSAGLLAAVNEILHPILRENLAAETPLWRDVLRRLGGADHGEFLALVRRRARGFTKNHGLLRDLAQQLGAAHRKEIAEQAEADRAARAYQVEQMERNARERAERERAEKTHGARGDS